MSPGRYTEVELVERPALDLLAVTRNLERIADHSTNIAEDVLFLVTGVDVRHHAESRKVG